jgi:hypothetical protein
MMLEGNRSSQN